MTNGGRVNCVALIVGLSVLTGMKASTEWETQRKRQVKVIGTVVARVLSATTLVNLTSVPNEEILIVRLQPSGRGQKPSYVKIVYQRWHNEPELPSDVLNSKTQWHFALERKADCDSTLKSLLHTDGKTESPAEVSVPRLNRTVGAEAEEIPSDTPLFCYLLRPGSLRKHHK